MILKLLFVFIRLPAIYLYFPSGQPVHLSDLALTKRHGAYDLYFRNINLKEQHSI